MSANTFDAIVIGGGANGLVASTRLAKAGVRTLLIEGGEALGGQSRAVEFAPGFFAAPLGLDPGWLPRSITSGLALGKFERVKGDAGITVAIEPGSFLSLSRNASRGSGTSRSPTNESCDPWSGASS